MSETPITITDPLHYIGSLVMCKRHWIVQCTEVELEWNDSPDPDEPEKRNRFVWATLACGCRVRAWQRDVGI